MKLNQAELDAVTWKIVGELKELRELAILIAQNKARQLFESDNKLQHAYDVLKQGRKHGKYQIELTFSHPKIVDILPHYEIKNRLIISQIGNKNIDQVIKDLTKQIAIEIGL